MKTDAIKAFVAAQKTMGAALKTANNPAFRSKYADLESVRNACFPALHENGFAVMQPNGHDDHGEYVETMFLHESGEAFSTRVYLKLSKSDMQGYGSAITYARRYGLMALAGIAPEDDDGNAAAKYAPKPGQERASTITADQFTALRNKIEEAGADEEKFAKYLGVDRLHTLPADRFDAAMAALSNKIKGNANGAARDA